MTEIRCFRQNVKTKQCNLIVKAALNEEATIFKVGVNTKMFVDTIFVHKLQKAILFDDLSAKGYRINRPIKTGFTWHKRKPFCRDYETMTYTTEIVAIFLRFSSAGMINRNRFNPFVTIY